MLESFAGKLLVASPILEEPTFARTVILVCVHDAQGAFGLVLNRPLEAPAQRFLPDYPAPLAEPAVVFDGGPVDASSAFALGYGPAVEDDVWSRAVLPGVGLIDLERVDEAASAGVQHTRLFSGYAGWVAGQLESEIMGEAWFIVQATADDIFTSSPERLWHDVLRRQSGPLSMFAFFPDDPRVN